MSTDKNKNKKYKFVFESAKKFLNDIISKYPDLNKTVLEKHLEYESKFENILDANYRLIESLSNRNMMASVIGFNRKEEEIREIIFEYDPTKIVSVYKNPDELLDKFKRKFRKIDYKFYK